MRHGYPTAMGHGTPITILKRGLGGTSQMDTQVRNQDYKIYYFFNYPKCNFEFYLLTFCLEFRLVQLLA